MKLLPCLLLAATALALSACATTDQKTADGKPKPKVEYVWYTPIGSNIPVKVPKDVVVKSDSDPGTAQDQEALRQAQQTVNSNATNRVTNGGGGAP